MRSGKYRVVTRLERVNNRLMRLALHTGITPRAFALLETIGRRSGQPRHIPVGNGLVGDTFWLLPTEPRLTTCATCKPTRRYG